MIVRMIWSRKAQARAYLAAASAASGRLSSPGTYRPMKLFTASTARPNCSPRPARSVPNIAVMTTCSVSAVRSWSTRTGVPAAIAGRQRASRSRAAEVMAASNVSTWLRRSAGAHMCRCRAQSSPSLVSSPLPSSGRSMTRSGVPSLV